MGLRFTGVCLITEDVPGLARFYATVFNTLVYGDETFSTVASDGATLSVFAADGMEKMAPRALAGAGRGALTIEFMVSDVDQWSDRLRAAGVSIVKPPTTQPWGRRSVWLRDPDGNIVNLYQPVPPLASPEEIVRRYLRRVFTERDAAACDEMLTPEYVDHDAPAGTPPGPEATRASVVELLEAHPDLAFTIDQLVAEDRLVAVRARWRGTHRDTGAVLNRSGLLLIRVDHTGRIERRRSVYDA